MERIPTFCQQFFLAYHLSQQAMAAAYQPQHSKKVWVRVFLFLQIWHMLSIQITPPSMKIGINQNSIMESFSRYKIKVTYWTQINANARYATNSPGIVLLDEVARRAKGVELQRFVVRNDSSCGSTIGPMLSAKLGLRYSPSWFARLTDLRTVDLGNPQLSMHSCRETGGSKDVEHAIKLFTSFFENFRDVEPYVYGGELKLWTAVITNS